jgi:hypothetical protein
MTDQVLAIFFLIISILSIMEYRTYVKEYLHFKKVGIRKKAKVISCFWGRSENLPIKLPIRGLPIVEIDFGDKKLRLKTFHNQFSPLTTFAFYNSEVNVLFDANNKEYCMIDWKIVIVLGLVFIVGFISAFIYFTGLLN